MNNYLRQEYLAWFARTFPRLYDTKATALFRARMQICFQTIRKKLFPPPPHAPSGHGGLGGGGGGHGGPSSSSVLSIMPSEMPTSGTMGGTGYPDRGFGTHSGRREEHQHAMGAHSGNVGAHPANQHQQHSRQPPQQPTQMPSQQHQQSQLSVATPQHHQQPQQQLHPDDRQTSTIPDREESRESASVDVKCHDLEDGSGGGASSGGSGANLPPDMNDASLGPLGLNSFIDVAGERNSTDSYPFGQC